MHELQVFETLWPAWYPAYFLSRTCTWLFNDTIVSYGVSRKRSAGCDEHADKEQNPAPDTASCRRQQLDQFVADDSLPVCHVSCDARKNSVRKVDFSIVYSL